MGLTVVRTVEVHYCQELLQNDGDFLQALVVLDVVFDKLGTSQALVRLLVHLVEEPVRRVEGELDTLLKFAVVVESNIDF